MSTASLRRAVLAFVVAGAVLLGWGEYSFRARMASEAMGLESIAAVVAAELDGDAHERIRGPQDAGSEAFVAIRRKLLEASNRYHLRSDLYTLRPVRDERGRPATEFVVMTNPTPFVGERYERLAIMDPVFERGARAHSGLYRSASGWWLSGYAPIRAGDGRVVALLEVDRPSQDYAAERRYLRWMALLGAAVSAVVAAGLLGLLARRRGRASSLLAPSLAVRIALAGTLPVLLAVGIVGFLDHREGRRELVEHLGRRLLTAVQTGAPFLDPELHEQVARTGDANSSAFLELREALRRIQAGAELSSPMYTLRRDGELVRFVVMTNEMPFVGDSYELRPGVRRTFEQGGSGTEGPYTDAHGTWLSAWAPLVDAGGRVTAVLQADYEVGALLLALRNRTLRRAGFALVGVLVALAAAGLLARSVARPVLELASASELIASGELTAHVDIERQDEVGTLARSFNKMVHNLQSMAGALQSYAAAVEQNRELEIAVRLQAALARREPLEAPGVQACGRLEPAEAACGTTYDYFLAGGGAYLVVALARAPAVGIEAIEALVAYRRVLGELVQQRVLQPRELLDRLNHALAGSTGFAGGLELLLGVYDLERRSLAICNAGCPYPYLLRAADGALVQLAGESGPPPGQDASAQYGDFELEIAPGDRWILYSAQALQLAGADAADELALDRLEQAILRHASASAESIVASLLDELRRCAPADRPLSDDLAFVALAFDAAAAEPRT